MLSIVVAAVLTATSLAANSQDPALDPPTEAMFFQDLAWSPNGEWIAYSRYAPDPGTEEYRREDWSVVVARPDGSEERVVVENAQWVAWSPDGNRLAFSSFREGDWNLYTINVDGSSRERLTPEGSNERAPNWSPGGRRIAFTSDRDGNSEVYVLSLEGERELRRLTFDDADDHNPVWAPDGDSLVFYRAVNGGGADQVYRISADGSQEWRLTNDQDLNIFPGFLADGRISWTSKSADSGAGRLMIFDPDTATAAPIGPEGAFFGRWSPDGARVAFIAGNWPAAALYLMNVDGSSVRKIVN